VDELTPYPVLAVSVFMELLAELCFVHRWNVHLLLQLTFSVSECTILCILAGASLHEATAEFGLLFDFVVLGKHTPIVLKCKRIELVLDLSVRRQLEILVREVRFARWEEWFGCYVSREVETLKTVNNFLFDDTRRE